MSSDVKMTIEELELRLEAAREMSKRFMLESQQKEREANRLASDLAATERENERLAAALEAALARIKELEGK